MMCTGNKISGTIFSVYFRLFPYRNNFWFFGVSLSNSTMAVGTIFFPWEQFFFQYLTSSISTWNFQVEVLSSTKIVHAGNRTRIAWMEGECANLYTVRACWKEDIHLTLIYGFFRRGVVGPMAYYILQGRRNVFEHGEDESFQNIPTSLLWAPPHP